MAKMFRPYSAGDVMGRFSGEEILGGGVRTGAEDGQRFIELRDGEFGQVEALPGRRLDRVQMAAGVCLDSSPTAGWWCCRFSTARWKADGSTTGRSSMASSERSDIAHFQGTPEGALYQRDCAPCHTSQLRYNGAAASPATAQFREGGIDCEMCHGPSQAHVDAMRARLARRRRESTSAAQLPVDFRKIPAEQSVAICEQCHMQSLAHEPEAGRSGELFADRRSLLSVLQYPSAFGLQPQGLLLRRPFPLDDFHRRSLRTIALLSRREAPPACRATISTRTNRPGMRNPSDSRQIPTRCVSSAIRPCATDPSGIRATPPRARPAAASRATCRAIWMRCCSVPARTRSTKFPMPK